MYRARVEAVSGLKVRAGGKWLTCIGNRNVKVGDLIWTDGRCVYGYEQTPQQPFVITSDDCGIPIIIDRNFYTYKNYLKDEGVSSDEQFYCFSNDKRGNLYVSTDKKILASNVKDGNFYYLIEDGDNINIVKNDAVIKFVENSAKTKVNEKTSQEFPSVSGKSTTMYYKYAKVNFADTPVNMEDEQGNAIPFLSFEWMKLRYTNYATGYTVTSTPINEQVSDRIEDTQTIYYDWAFIEDEKNWAIVVTNICEINRGYITGVIETIDVSNVLMGEFMIIRRPLADEYRGTVAQTYYISSSGENLIFDYLKKSSWCTGYSGYEEGSWNQYIAGWLGLNYSQNVPQTFDDSPADYNIEPFLKQQFPIHDGFFFTVNSVTVSEQSNGFKIIGLLGKINITIFTQKNKPFFTGTFYYLPYISVCKTKNQKWLLGVFQRLNKRTTNEVIGKGLYEISGDKLNQISYNKIFNQCLRPMKKYKHWWEKIQSLD